MSEVERDTPASPAARLVHHFREQAMAAVGDYDEALTHGGVPEAVQRDLAKAALDYYNALHEHREEDALDEPWDERGITWLEEAEGATVEVKQQLPRSNGATTTRRKPMLMAVDPERLRNTIRELNEVANELGFGPEIANSVHRTEISDEVIEEVEEWRQENLE